MLTTLRSNLITSMLFSLIEKFHLFPGSQLDWSVAADVHTIQVRASGPTRAELSQQVRESGLKHKRDGEDVVVDPLWKRECDDE